MDAVGQFDAALHFVNNLQDVAGRSMAPVDDEAGMLCRYLRVAARQALQAGLIDERTGKISRGTLKGTAGAVHFQRLLAAPPLHKVIHSALDFVLVAGPQEQLHFDDEFLRFLKPALAITKAQSDMQTACATAAEEDNKKLIVDLKDLFSGTINAIMDALDSKDSYTLGRSRRVAFYTSKIIAAMDLNKTEKATIELAALLHDIGMIGVQEDILHKVEKLTDEEREEIRKHVFYSVKILEDIKQLDKVTDIIRYHHEFYNGAGYPFGIKGEEIPLGARIIAIADAYDSLVSFRPYREGLTPEEALKIIEEKRGEQFDPNILDIFENVVDEANKEWDKLNPYV